MEHRTLRTVLIANRGEIALRLIHATNQLALNSVAVFVSEEATSPHVKAATHSFCIGTDPSSYNHVPSLLAAAKHFNADAVLPGYGFIAENAQAATAFVQHRIQWIGPSPQLIRLFGLKHDARRAAIDAKVPVIPGSEPVSTVEQALAAAHSLGFPVLVKASAGGGGMGQAVATSANHLPRAYHSVIKQCQSLFSNTQVYVERYIERARHIEVQVFGDGRGNVLALGDRECSVQRRRQKLIEEANAPNLSPQLRTQLRQAAATLCAQHNYKSAGTVEFILDRDSGQWYFLEVNTRLQVEHGITELVTALDIVQYMLLQASGVDVVKPHLSTPITEQGAAIEARIYAENPAASYAPSSGTLSEMQWPVESVCPATSSRIRVDAWAERGTFIPPHYDPLLGKVLAWGRTRPLAILALQNALRQTKVRGVSSNVELLLQTLHQPSFLTGSYTTGLLNTFRPAMRALEVLKPGLQSSLQDYPGRVGFWHIGVSPSGPMDAYAMCMANALVGNSLNATALEITVSGPTLLFHCDVVVAITGGNFAPTLEDGKSIPTWTPCRIPSGSVLTISRAAQTSSSPHGGKIAYLAVRGGFDAPKYLGSSSTFPTGRFGGLTGSFLVTGDLLPVQNDPQSRYTQAEQNGLLFRWPVGKRLPSSFVPNYATAEWTVAALSGPHSSLDFLEQGSLDELWTASYSVHHATNRLGARLIGPTPKWTRSDGGSAGLHPSNLHDYTYAPGAVNFSGNTPIILMLDGPSLGGFVCPITLATSEIWKVAQASAGETVRFRQVDFDQAQYAMSCTRAAWDAVRVYDLDGLRKTAAKWSPSWLTEREPRDVPAVLACLDPAKGDSAEIKVQYRMSGDEHVLVEYGDIELDLSYRFRVHMLMEELKQKSFVKELCPGVRSVLIKYDPTQIHVIALIQTLTELENGTLGSVEDVVVASRKLELPLAFADRWTTQAQSQYLRSVRPNAPYMPSNIEFIRRINGLDSIQQVEQVLTSAQYMVLGLGDVYLGAPCAVPVDPRHRMVTSKYNPARTYTPEGAVGIGGAYLCIYGMDSPGGYQLAGRTLPIWDNYGNVPEIARGAPKDTPWLLRFFDRISFFSVSDEELEEIRSKFLKGHYEIKITNDTFSYKQYLKFCEENRASIKQFETKRQAAYAEERARWEADGEGQSSAAADHASRGKASSDTGTASISTAPSDDELPDHHFAIRAGMSASVWSVQVVEGENVEEGQSLFALESMKVEIDVEAPATGVIRSIGVAKGDVVSPETLLCVLVPSTTSSTTKCDVLHLRNLYSIGIITHRQVVDNAMDRAKEIRNVFTSLATERHVSSQLEALDTGRHEKRYMPLFGIPFTTGANIDVEGYETDAGIDGLSYAAKRSSLVVEALQQAGAVFVGKTSVDQLNIGYTHCETGGDVLDNPVYPGHVCGGNGSAAVAVLQQVASFALVLDRNGNTTTAPALTSIVGIKTSEGLIPCQPGPVDCLSVYANTASDLKPVYEVCLNARDQSEAVLRSLLNKGERCQTRSKLGQLAIGVCTTGFSSSNARTIQDSISAYDMAIEHLKNGNFVLKPVDMTPFETAADLCNDYPLNYLKLGELHDVMQNPVDGIVATVVERMTSLRHTSVSALGRALCKLDECKTIVDVRIWSEVDALILPVITSPSNKEEVHKDVQRASVSLSHYAQLVTCLDLCALTLPLKGSTPGGIMILAPAMEEEVLLEIGSRW
ncbi:Urea amidolyase [Gracilariopsis chorda]|uniref:Urea amidolyase n=1 Tax=Gracilariopsis chorda TaxID=448386 RepID=A0A2V3IK08_9FLOR|nr:Urea amidolyase [Gracilariopsis chorda]|eukprot:PXF42434.1 Urea amidolyase [Gracilariopsis chorda]